MSLKMIAVRYEDISSFFVICMHLMIPGQDCAYLYVFEIEKSPG